MESVTTQVRKDFDFHESKHGDPLIHICLVFDETENPIIMSHDIDLK
jgi:hypothetical protein